jgi:hypothetical protein
MVLKHYYLGCLAHASYLLGNEASSTATIVDARDINQYLVDAEKFGLEVRHVFLTHFQAASLLGIWSCATVAARPSVLVPAQMRNTRFMPMKDGDTLEFPGLRVQVVETPGHTPSSPSRSSYLIWRRTRQNLTPCSPAIPCSSGTLAAPTCGLHWVGQPTISRRIFTTPSATSC